MGDPDFDRDLGAISNTRNQADPMARGSAQNSQASGQRYAAGSSPARSSLKKPGASTSTGNNLSINIGNASAAKAKPGVSPTSLAMGAANKAVGLA